MICAPLVSGFASVPGWAECGDNDNDIQALMSHILSDEPGVDLSMLTCSSILSFNSSSCDQGFFEVICADSCQYHGPCTGDGALAALFPNENMTCAMLTLYDALLNMGAITSDEDGTSGSTAEEQAIVPTLISTVISIGKKICGLPPARTAARRARKMTDTRPVDASKVHELAAAMLRSTKAMAHRLA